MKPKIFDRIFDGLYVPKRINENLWFRKNQRLLVWMANHPEGRKLLCIDDKSSIKGPITRIAKNLIGQDTYVPEGKLFRRVSKTEFRVGAKYANQIRRHWDWFCVLASEYNAETAALGLRNPFSTGLVPGLAFTTTTVYPDPDTETTSVDGYTVNVNATFSTCHDAAAGSGADDTADLFFTYDYRSGTTDYRIFRLFTLFDTSSIDDTDVVSAATLSLYHFTDNANDANSDSVSIVSANPASNTAIAAADYDQLGTTKYATDQTFASITAGQYYDFALNASGIAAITTTGVSKFGIRTALDIANSTPTGLGQRNFRGAETADTTSDPKLVVTHAAPAADVHGALSLLGVGI